MSKTIGTICLEGLQFYAHHGYFEEEQKLGNRYTVDIALIVDFNIAAENDKLSGTTDYTKVYKIIENVFAVKAKLLEHLAFKINVNVLEECKEVISVTTKVIKHNPPIGGICAAASVSLTTER